MLACKFWENQSHLWVEFIYWMDDGYDCYNNWSFNLKEKSLDEILEIKKTHDYFIKFRIHDCNYWPVVITPFVVFEPRMREEGELTLDECGYLFEDNLGPIRKVVQD